MQLSPQKEFIIAWSGSDPNDTDTLYVQAVVQDSKTLSVLNTVNLTDHGNHLFSKGFTTPHDNSQTSTGRQIFITITVYTDAGYTSPSQNYARETNHYIVQDRIDPAKFYGVSGGYSGGGYEFDYKAIEALLRKILKEEQKEMAVNYPVVLKQDFPIGAIIKAFKDEIALMPKPEPNEKVELNPLVTRLDGIQRMLLSMPSPSTPDQVKNLSSQLKDIATAITEDSDKQYEKQTMKLVKQLEAGMSKIADGIVKTMVDHIAQQIKDGKLHMSLFGQDNPFDTTKAKRETFLKGIAAKIRT